MLLTLSGFTYGIARIVKSNGILTSLIKVKEEEIKSVFHLLFKC